MYALKHRSSQHHTNTDESVSLALVLRYDRRYDRSAAGRSVIQCVAGLTMQLENELHANQYLTVLNRKCAGARTGGGALEHTVMYHIRLGQWTSYWKQDAGGKCSREHELVCRNSRQHFAYDSVLRLQNQQVLKTVKSLEKKGYTFEGADASVNLLVRRTMHGYVAPFK